MSGFLANLEAFLRPVYDRLIILGVFNPFYPSWDGIPLDTLDHSWVKRYLFKFDVFKTPLKYGRLISSDTNAPSLARLSCTCCTVCKNVIIFLLYFFATFGTCVRDFLDPYSRSVVNQVSLKSVFSDAMLCELHCTSHVKFWVFCLFPWMEMCKFTIKHHIKLSWDMTSCMI